MKTGAWCSSAARVSPIRRACPGFAGLVEKVYDALAVTPNAVQQAAIKAGQFDTAIGLLEADIIGGRETVRRTLAGILTTRPQRPERHCHT